MSRHLILAGTALAVLPSALFAAGIERNAPSSRILFEDGRYMEFSFSAVNPDLSGSGAAVATTTDDLFNGYGTVGFGYKADLNEKLSYAFILDEPVGVDTTYPVVAGSTYSGTTAKLDGIQLSGILAYDVQPDVKVYGGLRAQQISASASIPFVGSYTVDAEADWGFGYLAGVAWEKPEIAARVALTYYSEIQHTLDTVEFGAIPGDVDIATPQSLNLEFQTGVAPDTLLFGSVRWVDWSEFEITPDNYPPGVLVDYEKDWTTYTLGLGRRFTDSWSGSVQVSYEPPTDTVLTTLGPVDGRTSIGVAAIYTKDHMKVTTGITYVDLGDTTNVLGTDFSGGDAIGVGVRVGYTF